jgi:hypothetical protein
MSSRPSLLLEKGPLVITFYRGLWCPYCNLELQALNEVLPTLKSYGANMAAISPQTAVNSRKSVRTNQLGFPVLSDPRNETAAAFGLRFALPDYLIELYKKLKNDLPAFNMRPELDVADAGALCRRTGQHRSVLRSQSGLHAPSRPARTVSGPGQGGGKIRVTRKAAPLAARPTTNSQSDSPYDSARFSHHGRQQGHRPGAIRTACPKGPSRRWPGPDRAQQEARAEPLLELGDGFRHGQTQPPGSRAMESGDAPAAAEQPSRLSSTQLAAAAGCA